jgi:predicted double-glycine peptidase
MQSVKGQPVSAGPARISVKKFQKINWSQMLVRNRVSRFYVLGLILTVWPLLSYDVWGATDWLNVPFVPQVKAGCGSAAVAMVIEYWAYRYPSLQYAAEDTQRIDQLLPVSRRGIRGDALRKYFDARGFRAFVFDGELEDLKHHFEKGRPVIVCFAPKGPHAPLHYAVIVGVDAHSVWMNDPARGKLIREDTDRFLDEWKVTANWALLAVPRQAQ